MKALIPAWRNPVIISRKTLRDVERTISLRAIADNSDLGYLVVRGSNSPGDNNAAGTGIRLIFPIRRHSVSGFTICGVFESGIAKRL
jgi:hypothetical protein